LLTYAVAICLIIKFVVVSVLGFIYTFVSQRVRMLIFEISISSYKPGGSITMTYKLHMKASLVICFIVLGTLGCSQEPQDLSLPMKGGEYEVSLTKTSNDTKNPAKRSTKRCFKESSFDPFKSYYQNEDCKVTNINKGADKVSFDIDCKGEKREQTKGSLAFGVTENKLDWSIKINTINNKEVEIETKGSGEYLGKCK